MSDWTEGYVADIEYTYGHYAELNPLRIKLAFLDQGLVFPEIGTACELGFGQGLSTNLHAAASVVQWYGTDFNPSQAGFAQELSAASGAGAKLYDEAFDEFADRQDLPEFDYIALHGIWSWISDDNRQVIVDFIRKKLKVGGVLYISYNTLPGWGAFVPMRHLMAQHAELLGAKGQGIVNRIDGTLEFTEKLLAANPSFTRLNPHVVERLKTVNGQNRHYLAHEYFNRDWQPMHFSSMAELLQSAKLQYACSAHYMDHVDAINLTPDQQEFLKSISDPVFRESVRDFMVNQAFRRDYWVKGVRKLNPLQRAESLLRQRVILTNPRKDIVLEVTGLLGKAKLNESIYSAILDVLSDHQIKTISEIQEAVGGQGISMTQIIEVLILMSGVGNIAAVQGDAVVSSAKKQTDKLNRHLCNRARGSSEINYLSSPVTGGGHVVTRFQQLFLLSMQQGKKQPEDWAKDTWAILSSQGQRLIKEGSTLETAEDNLAELTAQANTFAEKQLPILRALQIA